MLLELLNDSEGITLESLQEDWHKGYSLPKGYLYFLILLLGQDSSLRIDNVAEFCCEWGIALNTLL